MNRDQITDLLEMVSTAYPNAKIKDPARMVSVWEMTFGEYDAETIYKAARLHMKENKYFPTPADIIEKIARADLLYSEAPQARIEAPTSSYVEDMINIDGVIEDIFNDEPSEECLKCKKYSKCYGKSDLSTDICHGLN